jgi:hypothetical protein
VAVLSLPCLVVVVEMIFVVEERRKEIGRSEPPEFAHTHTDHETVAGMSLKSFRMDLYDCGRLLAIKQRFENMGEVGHGSYTP